MPERSFSSENYRFGFNTQEKVDQISGIGNHNTALFWEYDTRLERRWNLDPKPRVGISDYTTFGGNPILNVDPDGAYFFGMFGSTSEQRQSAKAVASETGGDIQDVAKKSIHVNYSIAYSEFESGVTIEAKTARFRENGLLETGSVLIDDWNDQKLEALNQGRQIYWNESGLQSKYVYDGIKPDYTIESILIPAPKGIGFLYNGTIRGVSKKTLEMTRLGDAYSKINYYTSKAIDAGYSTTLTGAKVEAGVFTQLNHNIPRIIADKSWSTLYSQSAATIMGRTWQNQAIGLGLTNIVDGTTLSIYNFNQSIGGIENE